MAQVEPVIGPDRITDDSGGRPGVGTCDAYKYSCADCNNFGNLTWQYHKNLKNPSFAFRPWLLMAPSNESFIRILLPTSDLDRGNRTGLLLDALDVLDAAHQLQGLVMYSQRRVRQVRRVDLQFIAPTPTPTLQATATIIAVRKIFQIFYITPMR
jgi:hypothetical protein